MACAACLPLATAQPLTAQQVRVELQSNMLINEADVGDPSGLVDEQREIIGPPAGKPNTTWELNSKYWKQFPFSAIWTWAARRTCRAFGSTTPTARATW